MPHIFIIIFFLLLNFTITLNLIKIHFTRNGMFKKKKFI